MDYHVCGTMLSQIHTEAHQNRWAANCFVDDMEWFASATACDPQAFTDKAIVSFRNKLRSCVATAGGHFERSV